MTDPTDAELDEKIRLCEEYGLWPDELRLAKALRACRLQCEAHRRCTRDAMAMADAAEEQSKAKDAVVEALGGATAHETMHAIAWAAGVQSRYERAGATKQAKGLLGTAIKCLRVLDNALAALGKGTDD